MRKFYVKQLIKINRFIVCGITLNKIVFLTFFIFSFVKCCTANTAIETMARYFYAVYPLPTAFILVLAGRCIDNCNRYKIRVSEQTKLIIGKPFLNGIQLR